MTDTRPVRSRCRGLPRRMLPFLLALATAPAAAATDYFVAANGDDDAPGTSPEAPWRTVARVNEADLGPGDRVSFRRGDVWREEMFVWESGSAGDPITFTAYGSGERPILSGADPLTDWEAVGGLPALHRGDCTWDPTQLFEDDLRLTEVAWQGSPGATYAQMSPGSWSRDPQAERVYVWMRAGDDAADHLVEASRRECCIRGQWSEASYITLEGLQAEKAHGGDDRGGICTGGGTHWVIRDCVARANLSRGIKANADHTLLDGCLIADNGFGLTSWSTTGLVIRNCHTRDNTGWEDGDGFHLGNCTDFLVEHNVSSGNDRGDSCDGIQLDGGAHGIVRYNLFEGNGNAGVVVTGSGADFDIYYNIVRNSVRYNGIAVARAGGRITIRNNMIYNGGSAGIRVYNSHPEGVFIENNIVVVTGTWSYALRQESSAISGYIHLDHNCYYEGPAPHAAMILWEGDDYAFDEFAAYQAASGEDAHSLAADPRLRDPVMGDFHLAADSPCADAGMDVDLSPDYDGVAVGSPPEIGAFELLDSSDLIPPGVIDDLRSQALPTAFDLTWTAPGDDGDEGTAARYELRYLHGRAIETEEDWEEATVASALPDPEPAGTEQFFRLGDLLPETLYGLSVRAYDEAENLSALGPGLVDTTQALPDTIPPAPVDDLSSDPSPAAFDLTWTAPGDDGDEGTAARYELRYLLGRAIETEEDWDEAQAAVGLPDPETAGSEQAFLLDDLLPETVYGLSLRAYDEAENLSALGPGLVDTTQALPDTIPPAPVDDLSSDPSPAAFDLTWTAPGDDGDEGTAARYELRYLLGRAIETEEDWDEAQVAAGLPDPEPAGSEQGFRLGELLPETAYGLNLRTYDEAENLSALGPAFVGTTLALPDTIPPAVVDDLQSEADVLYLTLKWSSPGDDGDEGTAARYELRYLLGRAIETEEDWQAAEMAAGLPVPLPAGGEQVFQLDDLLPETVYGLSLRAYDEAENLSALGPAFTDTTLASPDDLLPAIQLVTGSEHSDGFRLLWTVPARGGAPEPLARFELRYLEGRAIESEVDWLAASRASDLPAPEQPGSVQAYDLLGLEPETTYGLSLRASDLSGNLSPLWLPGLLATTLPETPPEAERDTIPPEAITDLHRIDAGETWVLLEWTAPADAIDGSVTGYALGGLRDEAPSSENWEAAVAALAEQTADLPMPAAPGVGERYTLDGLESGCTYALAMRAVDQAGNWSAIGKVILCATLPADDVCPEAPSAPTVAARGEDGWVEITWSAPPDEDVEGYLIYGRSESAINAALLTPAPVRATSWSFPMPSADEAYFVCVAAIDHAGNEGQPGPESAIFAGQLLLQGPFPHPIEDTARFLLTLPTDSHGAIPVRMQVYSVAGDLVCDLVDQTFPAGRNLPLHWDTRNDHGARVAPGLYFLKLEAGGETETRKIYVKRP